MNSLRAFVASLAVLSALGATACQSDSYAESDHVQFRVVASNTEIVVGDTVTLSTRSENTLGRDASVTWTTTGGDVKADQGGRIARATFEKPGTYTVTGQLELDGEVVQRDSVNIYVRPVR